MTQNEEFEKLKADFLAVYRKAEKIPLWKGCSFRELITKTPSCWLWNGPTDKAGYGLFKGKRAHRITFIEANGIPPKDKPLVCHSCDNPRCVNPAHLFAGSNSDNHRDCVKKKRHIFGSRHPMSKLTEKKVRRMRLMHANGWTGKKLAKRFGVSHGVACYAIRGTTWKHI